MANAAKSLSNAQLALLELFSENLSDTDMEDLREVLLEFRYQRLQKSIDDLWEQGLVNEEEIERWGKEHLRTPYESQSEFLKRQKDQ
mgnify:CR=1 FL=1